MLSTQANRATFIASVQDHIRTYGLDGIDIDFEYPAAMERNGPEEDRPNFTTLLGELRAALGTSKTISVALPASYHYLRGFEPDKVDDQVDYINLMTYDYHGPWDLKLSGDDGTAKPHTSSLDILDSMRLLRRAGVDFNKLNLGLAWYGRTYAVGTCKGTSCPNLHCMVGDQQTTGGGTPGPCTADPSLKSQLEIWQELSEDRITPTLDQATQTYWYNNNVRSAFSFVCSIPP
ncbi:hypothetical protein H1R20_g3664, partial [Candolleomyces eurysporus]